ncbi:MAG: hypothetical protein HKO70_00835, partial [Acidimicrobiia bacterium]|nr:hypothetical protein [Acidimicrobiia bacterium]
MRVVAATALVASTLVWGVAPASAATLGVNSSADLVDLVPGNGVCDTGNMIGPDPECTLRAAIQEANALAGPDTISLPAGTYTLALGSSGEESAAQGDLDITSDVTINGAGAATTIIQAGTTNLNGFDRLFDVLAGGVLDISDVTIRHGQETDGAAIQSIANVTIQDAIVTQNTAGGIGGGISLKGSGTSLTVRRVDFLDNTANDGGGIGVKDGTSLVEDSLFSGNTASRRGGGFHNDSATATITGSTFVGNSAGSEDGGAILNRGGGSVLNLTNSTLSGNSAARNGGGLSNESTVSLLNVTISGNGAGSAGGGVRVQSGVVNARNTIVAGNPTGGNCSNALFSQGYNLEDTNTCSFNQAGDQVNASPLLGPLQDNGGLTHTHALLTGSDAIDGGTNTGAPATDQRGVARPIDGDGDSTATVDVGAFEVFLGSYLDEFNSVAYDGSDGALDWTPNVWTEEQETTNPGAGRVRVVATAGFCTSGGCLRLEGDSSTKDLAAVRQVDLTGATTATLTYDYRRENYYSCGTRVQASGDGGGSWDTLATYGTTSGDDPSILSASHDLGPYIDGDPSDTQIRFISYIWCDSAEFFHADNVQIETDASPAACTDSDGDGLCDLEEDANTDLDNNPATIPGPDSDGDTTPNYLDADDDGDGTPTASEGADPNADGDPRDARDTDRDGEPDYLDAPTIAADGMVATEQKISDTQGGLTATLTTNDHFGRSVASIGDVDGDGITDLAVGAPFDDDGGSDRGAVYVLFINANGTVKSEQKISDTVGGLATALANLDEFGMGVAGIGDLDGDLIPDLAVGVHQDDDGGGNQGAIYILFLNPDGTVKGEQVISETQGGLAATIDINDRFGSSVAAIGDLDGDGLNDIVVGAKDDDDGGVDQGAVYVLFLNADGTVKAEQKISETSGGLGAVLDTTDAFGIDVAGLGDLDGDGLGDIAVGAYWDDDGGTDRGAAYVLRLNANGTVKAQQKISDTAGALAAVLDNNDEFGTSVAGIGDVDADGVPDLLVGAPKDDDGLSLTGAAYVLFLNNDGTVKAEQKISNLEGWPAAPLGTSDQFGFGVAGLGDLDGDGTIGLAVGVYGDDDGGPADRGAVYVLDLAAPPVPIVVNSTGNLGDLVLGDGVCDTGGTVGLDPE